MKKSCMCMCGVFETWWLFKAVGTQLAEILHYTANRQTFSATQVPIQKSDRNFREGVFYPLAVCLFVPRSINYKLNFEYNSVVCNIYRILFVVWLSEWVSERTNVKKPILQYQQIDIYIHHLFWKQMTADLGQVPTPTPTHTKRKRTIHWISYLHDRH